MTSQKYVNIWRLTCKTPIPQLILLINRQQISKIKNMAVIQLRPTHILYKCAKLWRSDVIKRHLWHVRRLTCNNWMAYLKNWTDNFFQIFCMGTSWVAVSINNITTRASREITSRKKYQNFRFNGVNVAKHWHVAGQVFAISDCLVITVGKTGSELMIYVSVDMTHQCG